MPEQSFDLRSAIRQPIGHRDEVPEFKFLQMGHYYGKITDVDLEGQAKPKENGQEGTKCWVFYTTITEPGPDVEPDALVGIAPEALEFPTRKFYGVNPATLWIHPHPRVMNANREFFQNMGFPPTKPMDECANEMLGKPVLIGIGIDNRDVVQHDGTTVTYKYNALVSLTGDRRKK